MNTQIIANGKTYTFSNHGVERALERGIKESWVIEAIESPDKVTVDRGGNDLYHRVITTVEGWVYPLIIVVKEADGIIVTVMEDDLFG
ncbi:MAG: DUF4258 domain-containing protein [Chloroflexi bacterium]|nr:DUF4258 domain-containing protein [Chloroflexota bacterium]